MVGNCCVPFCSGQYGKGDLSFHRFPSVLDTAGHYHHALSLVRRNAWIEALKQGPLSENQIRHKRVCSKHFIKGSPAGLYDKMDPDWIPSQNLGYESIEQPTSSSEIESAIKQAQFLIKLNKDGKNIGSSFPNQQLSLNQLDGFSSVTSKLISGINRAHTYFACSANEAVTEIDEEKSVSIDPNSSETEHVSHIIKQAVSAKVCRLCMKNISDAKNIFEDTLDLDNAVPIHLAMAVCLYPIQVSTRDPLPIYACHECLETLSNFVKFRTLILRNDKFQRERFSQTISLIPKKPTAGLKRKVVQENKLHIVKKKRKEYRPTQIEIDVDDIRDSRVEQGNVKSETYYELPSSQSFVELVNDCEEEKNSSKENVTPTLKSANIIVNANKNDYIEKREIIPLDEAVQKVADEVEQKDSLQSDQKFCSKMRISNVSVIKYANVSFCIVDGYLMEHKVLKGNTRYLKCALKKCPAVGIQEVVMPGVYKDTVITKQHNHTVPSEIDIKKQKFIAAIRKKLQNVRGSNVKGIYQELCKLDPDIEDLVPMRKLAQEICNL